MSNNQEDTIRISTNICQNISATYSRTNNSKDNNIDGYTIQKFDGELGALE